MRAFIVVLWLGFTQAERFNFGQSGSHAAIESRFRHRTNSVRSTATASPHAHRAGTELDNGRGRYSAGSVPAGSLATPVDMHYDKEFYSYSAPNDDSKDAEAAQRLAAAMRRSLRVIFIKAPENDGLANAVLQLAHQNAESKTAIYVLTKQTDVADLANQLKSIQYSKESKPAVHFVKYRTAEDAAHAQQIIQNEFDALGGGSPVSNEDVANVLNFSLKKEDVLSNTSLNNNLGSLSVFPASLNAFLPPKTRN